VPSPHSTSVNRSPAATILTSVKPGTTVGCGLDTRLPSPN
jgi:hypothetical protein